MVIYKVIERTSGWSTRLRAKRLGVNDIQAPAASERLRLFFSTRYPRISRPNVSIAQQATHVSPGSFLRKPQNQRRRSARDDDVARYAEVGAMWRSGLGTISTSSMSTPTSPDLPPGMEPFSKLGLVLPTDQPCSFAEA